MHANLALQVPEASAIHIVGGMKTHCYMPSPFISSCDGEEEEVCNLTVFSIPHCCKIPKWLPYLNKA